MQHGVQSAGMAGGSFCDV